MPQVYNISTLLSEVLKLIPLDPEDPAAFLGHPGHLDRNEKIERMIQKTRGRTSQLYLERLGSSEFSSRANRAKFVIILPTAPTGTGVILRKGKVEIHGHLGDDEEIIIHKTGPTTVAPSPSDEEDDITKLRDNVVEPFLRTMNQSTDTGANERNVEFDPKVFRSGKNSKRKSSGKEEKHKVLDTLSIETVRD